MAGGYLTDNRINRDMKYINDVNKIGYQNGSDKQKRQMYNLRKKYGDTIYKAGKFDANNLSKNNQVLYQKYNPDTGFTRERQSGQFNLIDTKLKNNQAVSDKQMKAYKVYGDKWNLTPHEKRAMTYQESANQASEQVDPLYKQALESLKKERHQNELDSGQVAANRGLGRSGLAADQLNKIAIATQSQTNELNANRATKIAELAQTLRQRDQDRLERVNSMDYQKSRDAVEDNRYNQEFGYQKTRDNVTDNRWNQEFNYRKSRDDVGDQQQKNALAFEKERFNSETEWRSYVYNNMSASEKAQLEWNKQQFGENMAWSIEESNRSDKLARDQMEFSAGQSGFQTP